MGVTEFSFIVLPLCLLWGFSPARLLQLTVVAGVFEAAAVLTIGGLGVQPGLLPAVLFVAYIALQVLLGAELPSGSITWRVTRPFVLFTIWAVVSSYVMPRVFEDQAFVWPQKSLPPFVLTALAPSPSNINQDLYLIINCVFLVAVALYMSNPTRDLRPFIRAYFVSGFLAAFVAFWQFGHKLAGLPYPDDLFYSNPGWAVLTAQTIGAVPRINGPFSEPSSLAGYMSAMVCSTGWLLLQGHRHHSVRVLFLLALLTTLVSTSTTGFAVLCLAGGGMCVLALVGRSSRLSAAVAMTALRVGLLFGAIIAGASVFVPEFNRAAAEVLDATLSKQQSSSYEDRTGADVDSLVAAVDTYGLGVGWGSNRSSSLLPGLLAGVGVPGVVGLLWFGFGVTRQVRRARRLAAPAQLLVIDASCGALTGFLLAAVIAAPTLSSVTFFLLLALLIGCTSQVMSMAWRQHGAIELPRRDYLKLHSLSG